MAMNAVLREKGEIESAFNELKKRALAVPDDRTKCWDELKAIDFIVSQDGKESHVLDVGTCKCRILESLYKNGYRHLYGCDLAPVEWRRRIYPYLFDLRLGDLFKSLIGRAPIRLSRQSLEHTDYPSGMFEFITSLSVIEHGVTIEDYFREMNRLLKNGGYLITSCDYWQDKINASDVKLFDLTWNIFSRREVEEMIAIAAASGFGLTEPLDLTCGSPAIELQGKRYTFIFFILRKERAL